MYESLNAKKLKSNKTGNVRKRDIQAHSRNDCYRGKAVLHTSVCARERGWVQACACGRVVV